MLQTVKDIRYDNIQKKHQKRAERKYRTGALVTICTNPELPALLEDGWVREDSYSVAVGSVRHVLKKTR